MAKTGPTFAELIAQQRGTRTNVDLEEDSGGTPKYQTWQRWAQPTGDRNPVPPTNDPEQLRRIAQVLHVTIETVWMAIGRSILGDIGRAKSSLENRLPADLEQLTEDDVDFHLTSLNRTIQFRNQLAPKKSRSNANAANGASVTNLRAARRSSGNEGRG